MGSVYGVEAFPLYWPEGWKRTPPRQQKGGRYQVSFAQARTATVEAVQKLGGRDILISSNIPLRRDGLPAANTHEPDDVGVAVYWTEGSKDTPLQHRVLACDCWSSTRSNLRAVNLSIEALLAIKRAGATQVLDQAYKGFTALPASTSRPWKEVLGLQLVLNPSAEDIKTAFRRRVQLCHPDTGGSHEAMAELNRAYTEGCKVLGIRGTP